MSALEHVEREQREVRMAPMEEARQAFGNRAIERWINALWRRRAGRDDARVRHSKQQIELLALRLIIERVATVAIEETMRLATEAAPLAPEGAPVLPKVYWNYDALGPGVHRYALEGAFVCSLVEDGALLAHILPNGDGSLDYGQVDLPAVRQRYRGFIAALQRRSTADLTEYGVAYITNNALLQRGVWHDRDLRDTTLDSDWSSADRAMLLAYLSGVRDGAIRFWLAHTLSLPSCVNDLKGIVEGKPINAVGDRVAAFFQQDSPVVESIRRNTDTGWMADKQKAIEARVQRFTGWINTDDLVQRLMTELAKSLTDGLRMAAPSENGRLMTSGRYTAVEYTYGVPFDKWIGAVLTRAEPKGLPLTAALQGRANDTYDITRQRALLWKDLWSASRYLLANDTLLAQDSLAVAYLPVWLWHLWKQMPNKCVSRDEVTDALGDEQDVEQTLKDALEKARSDVRDAVRQQARNWVNEKETVRDRLITRLLAVREVGDKRHYIQSLLNGHTEKPWDDVTETREERKRQSHRTDAQTVESAPPRLFRNMIALLESVATEIEATYQAVAARPGTGPLKKRIYGFELEGLAYWWDRLSAEPDPLLPRQPFSWRWSDEERHAMTCMCMIDRDTGEVRIARPSSADPMVNRICVNAPDDRNNIHQARHRMWQSLLTERMAHLYAQWQELPGMREHDPDTLFDEERAKHFLCDGIRSVVATLHRMAEHHHGEDGPPMDEGQLSAPYSTRGKIATLGGVPDMNGDVEELPDTCEDIQLFYLADLISADDPARRYPDQWDHVQNCLSCLGAYLEARDWAAELSASAQPQTSWRGLLRFDRCIALKGMVTAFVKDVQGTLVGFPPAFQGTVMLSASTIRSTHPLRNHDPLVSSAEDGSTREPTALTVDLEGFQVEVAVEVTSVGPRLSAALREAPYPAMIKVRLGEAETTLAGIGASGELPLREGRVEVQITKDSAMAG